MPSSNDLEVIREALADGRLTINALDDGSGVVLDVDREQLLTMNATGLTILQAVAEGAGSDDDVARRLSETFEVDEPRARADIAEFLREIRAVL